MGLMEEGENSQLLSDGEGTEPLQLQLVLDKPEKTSSDDGSFQKAGLGRCDVRTRSKLGNWKEKNRQLDGRMDPTLRNLSRTQTPPHTDTCALRHTGTHEREHVSRRREVASISRVHIAASSLASSENSRSKSRTVAVNRSHDGPEITERSVRRTEPRDGSPRETDRKSRTLRRAPACCSDDFRSDLILRKTLTYAKCTGWSMRCDSIVEGSEVKRRM